MTISLERREREKARRERWTEGRLHGEVLEEDVHQDKLSAGSSYLGICAPACSVGGIMREYGIEIKLTGQRRHSSIRKEEPLLKKLHF